jgi:hypothetical protein
LIALLALGVEALRRRTAREFPDASRSAALRSMRGRVAGMRSGASRRPTDGGLGSERLSELERLAALHDSGALDDAEFETQKARVLA